MALVDAGRRRVDDHEHLRGEIVAPAIKHHARHVNRLGFIGMGALVEIQRRQPMLPVNYQKFLLRFLQMPDRLAAIERLKAQLLRREQQHRAGYGWLGNSGLIKIANRAHLGAGQQALERLLAPLDARNKLRHVILLRYLLGFNLFALIVKPADEAHLGQEVFRGVRHKVKRRIFLANLRSNHTCAFRLICFGSQ